MMNEAPVPRANYKRWWLQIPILLPLWKDCYLATTITDIVIVALSNFLIIPCRWASALIVPAYNTTGFSEANSTDYLSAFY